jgi:hypothetical protein
VPAETFSYSLFEDIADVFADSSFIFIEVLLISPGKNMHTSAGKTSFPCAKY